VPETNLLLFLPGSIFPPNFGTILKFWKQPGIVLQRRQSVFFARLFEHVEQLGQALADNIGVSTNVYEIRITVPSGHDVYVQVSRQARPGASPEVHPYIEAVRVYSQRKRFLGFADELDHLKHFLVVGLVEVGDVPQGRYQEMPVVVRVAIEDYDALFASPNHEILVVCLRVIAVVADEAIGCFVQPSDIIDPPRRP